MSMARVPTIRALHTRAIRLARILRAPRAAALLALLLAACAANPGIETGSIGRQLETGGAVVKSAENRFEIEKVKSLAAALPICLAYRMPAKGPPLNGTFEQAWSAITAKAGGGKLPVTRASILHARFANDKAGSFPASTSVELAQRMRASFPGVNADYQPIEKAAFKPRAVCAGKDTTFVDVERLTFYRQEMPSDLTWSGEVHLGDVLFIELDGAKTKEPALAAKSE